MRKIKNAAHIASIAKDFAVPTLETAQRLGFSNLPAYAWFQNYYGSACVLTHADAESLKERHGEGYVTLLCNAPQLHELIDAFPEKRGDFLQAINACLMENENLTEACAICIIEGK